LRIATGVIGLTSLVLWRTDNLPAAMTVCIGALCASLMDLPGPLRHKFYEMLASVILCSIVTLVVSLCAPVYWLLGAVLVGISFLASMMVVYGKRAMPLQFAALFVMVLSMENTLDLRGSLAHAALVFAGGLSYLGYAMGVAWLIRRRTKQQVLAEALFELARYLSLKADCYDERIELNSQLYSLVRQQVQLADKQQASRDLLLRGAQIDRDATLVRVHYSMLDLYESIVSTHADYAQLRRYLPHEPVLMILKNLIAKTAADVEAIAYAVTRKRASYATGTHQEDLLQLGREMRRLRQEARAHRLAPEALTVLRTSTNKLREVIKLVAQLHLATQSSAGPLPMQPGADMTPFLTQQKYRWRALRANLRWESPIFRFALRVAMAVAVGLLVADHMPYAGHSYWILLTIVVILKPSFSQTRQRRSDRLIGTVIGCVLTAIILHFFRSPLILLGFLFLATAAAPTFVYVKYRYTAVAASMQILLQLSLLVPSGSHVITERLIDTAIGTVIASLFSFVLPNWEYRSLPRLLRRVLQANLDYIRASADLLQSPTSDDFLYRLARKRFMDDLANLSAALARMLNEPLSKQRAVQPVNRFIVQNYLVMAHIAAMRLLFRLHADDMPRALVNAELMAGLQAAQQMLGEAQARLSHPVRAPGSAHAAPDAAAPTADAAAPVADALGPHADQWSGWRLLQRRIDLLRSDVQQVVECSAILAHDISHQP
jgi:uncharacterized membrane protein YccC